MFSSTIIPTIGRATLSRAVNSVLNQVFPTEEYEIIVVNDRDNPIKEDWVSSKSVRVIQTNCHERSVARNTGAAIAKGRYLHFLDDDDWLLPGALEAFRVLDQSCNASWLYGVSQLVSRQDQFLNNLSLGMNGNCFTQVMTGEWIPLQASFIKAETFFEVGGFNNLLICGQDVDLCRWIALRSDFAWTPTTVVSIQIGREGSYNNHQIFLSSQPRIRGARENILNQAGAFSRFLSSARTSYWYGRILRLYATSVLWNLQHRKLFVAMSRSLYLLSFFALSGRHLFSKPYWKAVSHSHESHTYK